MNTTNYNLKQNMETIKILIAASEEMHEETLKFSEFIANLNEVLEPRGIELDRVKWNPEKDGSIDEFKHHLKDSELCLTLYWQNLAGNSEQELDTAYQRLKDGDNPRKLYVFFKEPSEGIAASLKDFKANFVSKYGHFFCKFENADTMNLHFILQFEAYRNQTKSDLVKVSAGKVLVGDKEMVNLENVPFAAMNKEYQRLQNELNEFDSQIADARRCHIADPDNEYLEEALFSLKAKRNELAKEFEKYQTHLYDIALNFAKLSGEHYSERMRKAREQFEMGNNIEADQILNMEEMKREARNELKLYEQNLNNLETNIEEFCLKADTVMSNTLLTIPDRFAEACDAYEEALSIAKAIHCEDEKLARILFGYAYLQADFNRMQKAAGMYQEALEILRKLASTSPDAYLPDVATTLNNLGALQSDLGRYSEAEGSYQEALEIRRKLASTSPDAYLPDVATTLNSLGLLQSDLGRYSEAEGSYQEAIEIYRKLASTSPDAYLPDVAGTLNNLGNLQSDLGRFSEAEGSYQEALEIHRKLASASPDAYLPDVAMTLNNLGLLQSALGRYSDAEDCWQEALEIYRRLEKMNPGLYKERIETLEDGISKLQ